MGAMNFLVFGAGFSAFAAIEALRRRDPEAKITATTRDSDKRERLSASGINALLFDGNPDPALKSAIAEATLILVSIAPGADGDPVLAACSALITEAKHLQWLGYYSTIGVYGDAGGAWIDEDYPTEILNARIGWRLKAEADWTTLAHNRAIPLAILRLAGIYGPGRSAFDKLRKGAARRIIKPGQVFNRIHNHDIGEITALAAMRRLAGIYNIADDEPAPPQDVIAYAATRLGIDAPPEIAFDEADMTPMARSFYSGNRRIRNDRIKAALGYEFAFPDYRKGLDAILALATSD